MDLAPSRRPRSWSIVGTALAMGLLGVTSGGIAHATSSHGRPGRHGRSCPPAESLVPKTAWHHHALAPGVAMSAGSTKDPRGVVNMHVLRVDLTRKTVSVHPLLHAIAHRSPLSALAKGHHLVAATNTGYFDFASGAPTDPVIRAGKALVISSARQPVVGLDSAGLAEAGNVWLSSRVSAGGRTHALVGLNEATSRAGLAVYTPKWGSRLPGRSTGVTRDVAHGAVTSGERSGRDKAMPSGDDVLVAHGRAASGWLAALPAGTKVSISSKVMTDAAHPFVQAYGVGTHLVIAGRAGSGFSCDSANTTQPARTAIGFTKGGRSLVIAVVADEPYTHVHGLDEDQMAKLMAQLGVSQAYAFDGSGSSELLAKLKGSSALTLQTFPADGIERPMPLGLGISVSRAKAGSHKPKHKHTH